MSDIEDKANKFRSNLLVYCTLVVVGVYLSIPLPTVLEKVLGVAVAEVSPVKLLVVQCVVFAYLAHRYYFASTTVGAVQQIKEQINTAALSKRYAFILREVKISNSLGGPTGSAFSHHHNDVVSYFNKLRRQQSIVPVAADELITKLDPPNEVSQWRYDMVPALHFKDSDGQFARVEGLNISYRFTRPRKIQFFLFAGLRTLLVGSALTEHMVPFLAVVGAAGAIFYKFYLLVG